MISDKLPEFIMNSFKELFYNSESLFSLLCWFLDNITTDLVSAPHSGFHNN